MWNRDRQRATFILVLQLLLLCGAGVYLSKDKRIAGLICESIFVDQEGLHGHFYFFYSLVSQLLSNASCTFAPSKLSEVHGHGR